MTNLLDAFYAALATVNGQEAADHARANPTVPVVDPEDDFDWETVQQNRDIARWGEAR